MNVDGKDVGLLTLRAVTGGLLAGHGAQKLFGWFGGHGLSGTGGYLESLGLRPGQPWAAAAGASEMAGGALTALGLLGPVGPLNTIAAMTMAAVRGHGGKPIWVTQGGGELPLTYAVIGAALALTGPGRLSLDRLFGVRVPPALTLIAAAGTIAGVAWGLSTSRSGVLSETAAAGESMTQTSGPMAGDDVTKEITRPGWGSDLPIAEDSGTTEAHL